jgi:glycosyltransferase involved in cell wall biosynthesis
LRQTYPYLEYVVLDGDSRDGTQERVLEYRDRIAKFISEPDRGISDAFNKAIACVSGDSVIIMNAGDQFYTSTSVEEVMRNVALPATVLRQCVVYGNTLHIGRFGKLIEKADHSALKQGRSLGHQASCVGADVYEKYQYDVRLPLSMDYDFWLRCLEDKSIQFHHVDIVVARFLVGGVSGAPSTRERAVIYDAIVRILNGLEENVPEALLRTARLLLTTRAKLRMRRFLGDQRYRSLKALFGRRDLNW